MHSYLTLTFKAKFPKISFILASIDNLSWRDEIIVADVNGHLTIKETSIPVVIPIQLRYLRAEKSLRIVFDGTS